SAVATAQKQLLESQTKRAELQTRTTAERDKIVHDVRSSQLRVQVLGPSQYLAEASNAYRVLTSDLEGKSVPARLSAQLVGSNNRVLFASDFDSVGDFLVALPHLDLAGDTSAQLQIVAAARESREEVQGRLNAGEPVYASHLALPKSVFHPGEKVLFRSVTLDRFTLKPPPETKPFNLEFTIKGPKGNTVLRLPGWTHPGGIGGGEVPPTSRLTGNEE